MNVIKTIDCPPPMDCMMYVMRSPMPPPPPPVVQPIEYPSPAGLSATRTQHETKQSRLPPMIPDDLEEPMDTKRFILPVRSTRVADHAAHSAVDRSTEELHAEDYTTPSLPVFASWLPFPFSTERGCEGPTTPMMTAQRDVRVAPVPLRPRPRRS